MMKKDKKQKSSGRKSLKNLLSTSTFWLNFQRLSNMTCIYAMYVHVIITGLVFVCSTKHRIIVSHEICGVINGLSKMQYMLPLLMFLGILRIDTFC